MKINRKYKIWEATNKDEFRPVMEYILFQNGHAYATNAHILVKIPLDCLFEVEPYEPEDQLKMLEGCCINARLFKRLCSYGCLWVEEMNGRPHIKVIFMENPIYIPLKSKDDMRFPNFEAVLNYSGPSEPIDALGISPELLIRLTKAMGVSEKIKMTFTKKNSQIFVEPLEEFYRNTMKGLIMPIHVD